jgi:hypothetical protein
MISDTLLRKAVVFGVCASLSLVFLGRALANETARRVEEEIREKLLVTESAKPRSQNRWGVDYGAWVNYLFIDYDDDDNDKALEDSIDQAQYFDVRPWAKVTFSGTGERQHAMYVRLKDLHSDLRPKETAGGSDHEGPQLDYGYCLLDFSPLWVKAGRQYFTVGQGLAYSDVHDGLEATYFFPKAKIKGFFSHTLPHQENIDTSVPGYDKSSERIFYGAEAEFTVAPAHAFYGFAIGQNDYSDENPQDAEHNYTYDSQYIGGGARGTFPCRVSYWLEGIKENGKSYIYDGNSKQDIDAWAGILAVSYNPEIYSHPSVFFKYAYGSGDKDRASVTDTFDGNASGDDRNFLYFGYIPAGYAFASRLSNLYFFKTGFTAKPLEKVRLFKDCSLGMDYYRFFKSRKTGGVYDIDATGMDSDLGYEIDASLSWNIFSDLSFTLQYGYFVPGKAYPDEANDCEEYLSLSTSLLF